MRIEVDTSVLRNARRWLHVRRYSAAATALAVGYTASVGFIVQNFWFGLEHGITAITTIVIAIALVSYWRLVRSIMGRGVLSRRKAAFGGVIASLLYSVSLSAWGWNDHVAVWLWMVTTVVVFGSSAAQMPGLPRPVYRY